MHRITNDSTMSLNRQSRIMVHNTSISLIISELHNVYYVYLNSVITLVVRYHHGSLAKYSSNHISENSIFNINCSPRKRKEEFDLLSLRPSTLLHIKRIQLFKRRQNPNQPHRSKIPELYNMGQQYLPVGCGARQNHIIYKALHTYLNFNMDLEQNWNK